VFVQVRIRKYALHKNVETRINAVMPAPRADRLENPLLKLRTILGNGERPMHQAEFAELITVPVATLRAFESGARTMTWENCLGRIGYLLGATFDERDGQWHYMRTKVLYTFALYQSFTEGRIKDAVLKTKCLHAFVRRALDLFKAVPPKRWLAFFGCMMGKLREAADEFEIKGRAKILEQTEPQWGLSKRVQDADGTKYPPDEPPRIFTMFRCFNYQTDEALRAEDAGGLLDFREWREFNSAAPAPDSELREGENT
jgi:hypothetical protein